MAGTLTITSQTHRYDVTLEDEDGVDVLAANGAKGGLVALYIR